MAIEIRKVITIPKVYIYEDCFVIVKEMEPIEISHKNTKQFGQFGRVAIRDDDRNFTTANNVEKKYGGGIAGLGLVVDTADNNTELKEINKIKTLHKNKTECGNDTDYKENRNGRKYIVAKEFERAKNESTAKEKTSLFIMKTFFKWVLKTTIVIYIYINNGIKK